MIRSRVMAGTLSVFLVGITVSVMLIGTPVEPAGLPVSFFVVHCEPTRANEGMFLEMTKLVSLADQFAVSLTIDFTAQWADRMSPLLVQGLRDEVVAVRVGDSDIEELPGLQISPAHERHVVNVRSLSLRPPDPDVGLGGRSVENDLV